MIWWNLYYLFLPLLFIHDWHTVPCKFKVYNIMIWPTYIMKWLPQWSCLAEHLSSQFSCSVMRTLCDPMNCSTPGLPVRHQLLEFTQTHVHWVGDAIQPSHPLPSLSPPTFNLSQHHSLFQWVTSSHQVSKVLEFQLQYQSFQCIFRTDFL